MIAAHKIFAQILDGEVINVLIGEDYPEMSHRTKCILGNEAYVIDCFQIPCGIGSKYHDSRFWKVNSETGEETEIFPLPTEKQEIERLTYENKELTLALAEMIGGV